MENATRKSFWTWTTDCVFGCGFWVVCFKKLARRQIELCPFSNLVRALAACSHSTGNQLLYPDLVLSSRHDFNLGLACAHEEKRNCTSGLLILTPVWQCDTKTTGNFSEALPMPVKQTSKHRIRFASGCLHLHCSGQTRQTLASNNRVPGYRPTTTTFSFRARRLSNTVCRNEIKSQPCSYADLSLLWSKARFQIQFGPSLFCKGTWQAVDRGRPLCF